MILHMNLRNPDWICTARVKRTGLPCKRWATTWRGSCRQHGGSYEHERIASRSSEPITTEGKV